MSGVKEIDAETAKAWADDGEAVLVDVRELPELMEAAIDGAVHVPMSAFDPGQVPIGDGRKVVFFCAHGMRSYNVGAWMVAQGGLDEAYSMTGGIVAWAEAGLPHAPGGDD